MLAMGSPFHLIEASRESMLARSAVLMSVRQERFESTSGNQQSDVVGPRCDPVDAPGHRFGTSVSPSEVAGPGCPRVRALDCGVA